MLGVLILSITAFILGTILVIINSTINKVNPKEREIEDMLPGLNCGGCGYGSCHGMACEILKNKDSYKSCRPLRGEKKEKLEEYLKTLKN